MTHPAIQRLKSTQPAQPMPAGRLEFWGPTQTTGMRIILTGPRGVSGEHALSQIWPPTETSACGRTTGD